MYRVIWMLPGSDADSAEIVEEVFPRHADELAREGCWKLIAGRFASDATSGLVIEIWTDSETTSEALMASDAIEAFRKAIAPDGGLDEVRGAVDETVTMHISALRMG